MGGADPLGGANLRCGHFSAKMYVKTKELGPIVGGAARAGGAPLGSATGFYAVFNCVDVYSN